MENSEEKKISEVKGAILASIPKFIKSKFGENGFSVFLTRISLDAKSIFQFPIDENDWYPAKVSLIEPMANIAQLFYDWDLKKSSWELGRFSADFSIKSFKKLAFKFGSTVFFLRKAAEFMDDYYRPAIIIAKKIENGEAVFHITEFPQIESTIEFRIAGWIERVLEIANNKNIKVVITSSLSKSDPYTEIVINWK